MQFILGDVGNLPPGLGQFGCVLVLNFICGMEEPMKLFKVLPELVVPGGILVIMDHYSYCEKVRIPCYCWILWESAGDSVEFVIFNFDVE